MAASTSPLRMGRIDYLNVLPVYYALESGDIPHDYELVYGPPAELNNLMAEGKMLLSSTSCVEYAKRPERYLILPNLAIGSNGPVQSVLLFSRRPIERLGGQTILASRETHTSVTLMRLFFQQYYAMPVQWRTGSATAEVNSENPPEAFLAIGDEALRLRRHNAYPYVLDLAELWTTWTGLPFVFALWVVERKVLEQVVLAESPAALLSRSRDFGAAHMDTILAVAQQRYNMTKEELQEYFAGLHYSLGAEEQAGLQLFYAKLAEAGIIPAAPKLCFMDA